MDFDDFVMEGACMQVVVIGSNTVILLPLRPVSLMYKNPLRCKIIHTSDYCNHLVTYYKAQALIFNLGLLFFNGDSLFMDIGAHDFSQDESQDTI